MAHATPNGQLAGPTSPLLTFFSSVLHPLSLAFFFFLKIAPFPSKKKKNHRWIETNPSQVGELLLTCKRVIDTQMLVRCQLEDPQIRLWAPSYLRERVSLGFGQVWEKLGLSEKHEREVNWVGSSSFLDWGQEKKRLGPEQGPRRPMKRVDSICS